MELTKNQLAGVIGALALLIGIPVTLYVDNVTLADNVYNCSIRNDVYAVMPCDSIVKYGVEAGKCMSVQFGNKLCYSSKDLANSGWQKMKIKPDEIKETEPINEKQTEIIVNEKFIKDFTKGSIYASTSYRFELTEPTTVEEMDAQIKTINSGEDK